LEALGTEQNRKVYRRHGVGDNMYGVSYANLGKLAKKIKRDHALALALWESGNHDARVLATMIADPGQFTSGLLEAWAKGLDNHVQADAFANLAARTALAREKMARWVKSKSECVGSTGWGLLARLAVQDAELADDFFEPYLAVIERDIHRSQNRVKYAMNGALIAVGMRNERLRARALAAAAVIGKVEVDHGETGCKTPDAAEYIRKAAARKKR
jgi:3-methyladenine DNA glycosylase AlkD